MADGTKIEWTDATWNPITGCSVVSPGCTNCYAMKLSGTRLKNHQSREGLTRDTKAGPVWTGEVRFNPQWLDQPLRWKKPRMIFVCAHGDLFAEGVPDEWIDHVFAVMALAPQHTFQVLTKRPERMRDYLQEMARCFEDYSAAFSRRWGTAASEVTGSPCAAGAIEDITWPIPNIWLGVSVEDQKRADERIPILLNTPAAIHWISAEPLLGPLDLKGWCSAGWDGDIRHARPAPRLRWVVAGGESGAHARPMHPGWARQLRDQCAAANVPLLFKQWGNWRQPIDGEQYDTSRGRFASPPAYIVATDGTVHCFKNRATENGGTVMLGVGKKAAGRQIDGIEHNSFPEIRR